MKGYFVTYTLEVHYLCWALKVTHGIKNIIVFHIYWIHRMESRKTKDGFLQIRVRKNF